MPKAQARRAAADPIAVVEAAYRVDEDEDVWLERIRTSLGALVPAASLCASLSLIYRAPSAASVAVERVSALGIDGQKASQALLRDAAVDPEYVRDSLLSRPCDFVSAVPGTERQVGWQALRTALAVVDGLAINGLDSSGLGVISLLLVKRRPQLSEARRATFARVAAHVVAGLRLRRRLASAEDRVADADAVLSVAGEVTHATGNARLKDARLSLRMAARGLERARGSRRRSDSDRAVLDWRVLVDQRWSLLDHFERDGKRYLLACRNSLSTPTSALLSPRERQVVLLALRGHFNKLIGYELGITTSTVGVLLGRAAARLGVTSRRALLTACANDI